MSNEDRPGEPARAGAARTPDPPPDTTAAAAVAPPPPSGAALRLFVAALVLVVCGVAGVLMLFTDLNVGYALLLLVLAGLAAAVLGTTLRRGRS